MQQKRQSLKNGRHTLTVRMQPEDFDHLLIAQAKVAKKERRKVTLNELVVTQIRTLPR